MEIPQAKREKYVVRLEALLEFIEDNGGRCTPKLLLSVHGSLMRCTFVMKNGRGFLAHTQRLLSKFKEADKFKMWDIKPPVRRELEWWRATLAAPSIARMLKKPELNDLYQFRVDASTGEGIGMVMLIEGVLRWEAWK